MCLACHQRLLACAEAANLLQWTFPGDGNHLFERVDGENILPTDRATENIVEEGDHTFGLAEVEDDVAKTAIHVAPRGGTIVQNPPSM